MAVDKKQRTAVAGASAADKTAKRCFDHTVEIGRNKLRICGSALLFIAGDTHYIGQSVEQRSKPLAESLVIGCRHCFVSEAVRACPFFLIILYLSIYITFVTAYSRAHSLPESI